MLKSIAQRIIRERTFHTTAQCCWNVTKQPGVDIAYLCNKTNLEEIQENVKRRKGVGDINVIHELKKRLDTLSPDSSEYKDAEQNFTNEVFKIPNNTHPSVVDYGEDPKVLKFINKPREFDQFPARDFAEISKRLNLVRTEQLGNVSGSRSYYFMGEMAELEQALIQYTVGRLIREGFKILSVPDILHRDIIESCGMDTRGPRAQVYSLDPHLHGEDLCLSGTSEMALGGYFSNKVFNIDELPIKVAAVSRCYRAEVSSVAEERGIYRVHQFTKVEMFSVSEPKSSEDILEEFLKIQEDHFGSFGIHLRTLDMPPHELGAPAYRKYDVEAWMPGRGMFGEVSSCSNCTDYQARRLNIRYKEGEDMKFVHTINGTACAIPRMLIALLETFQNNKGTVSIPEVLQKYMRNKTLIGRQKKVPELKLIKHKK